MRALDAFTPAQVKMSGIAIDVSPKHALALSLALHELATNATKYGALSCPEGRVTRAVGCAGGNVAPGLGRKRRAAGCAANAKRVRQPVARRASLRATWAETQSSITMHPACDVASPPDFNRAAARGPPRRCATGPSRGARENSKRVSPKPKGSSFGPSFTAPLKLSSDRFIKRHPIHSATLLHRMFQTLAKRLRGIRLHDEYRAQSRGFRFHSAVTCCEN